MPSPPARLNAHDILRELRPLGRDSYKRVMMNHGVPEPFFGVKIEDLKKIQKRIRTDYQLALDLYDTRNYDAMYLAGLIADASRMTKCDLQRWMKGSTCEAVANYVVSRVAADGAHGWDLALEWIESEKETVAAAGWATLSGIVSTRPDEDLDLTELKKLIQRVAKTIHDQPDGVRYQMNGFVIAAGCFVPALTAPALDAARRMGVVAVDMGNTDCRVPDAESYIRKVQARDMIGRKRKSARC